MSDEKTTHEIGTGTILRGADGKVYVIPDEDLEAFRAPDEVANHVEEHFDKAKDQIGSHGQLSPQIEKLTAIRGPLIHRDLLAGPGSPTVIPSLDGLHNLKIEAVSAKGPAIHAPAIGTIKVLTQPKPK
jgi:hypothetical protein